MFGPLILIRRFLKFLKLPNNLRKVLLTDISYAYLVFLYSCGLNLDLKPREVINHFPDLSNFTFDSEYVIFILFRL